MQIKIQLALNILCLKVKHWWLLFYILQLTLIVLIIGSLGAPRWTSMDIDYKFEYRNNPSKPFKVIETLNFSGGIAECFQSCHPVDSFSNIRDDICQYQDNIKSGIDTAEESIYLISAMCKSIDNLTGAAAIKVILDIFSMFAILIWCVSMTFMLKLVYCTILSICCSVCSSLCYIVGSIMWFIVANAKFSSCSWSVGDGDNISFCAKDGPAIMVAIILLMPIFCISFCVISAIYINTTIKKTDEARNATQNISSVQVVYPPPDALYGNGKINQDQGYTGNKIEPSKIDYQKS